MSAYGTEPATTANPAGLSTPSARNWLERVHPEYRERVSQWVFVWDHYAALVTEPNKVQKYLVQKAAGETDAAFEERCRLADYTNHFATAVDSLAGMLYHAEPRASRVYERAADPDAEVPTLIGLGDPTDPLSIIGRLNQRADEDGNGLPTVYKLLAPLLLLFRQAWQVVEGPAEETCVRTLLPMCVTNWRHDPATGQLTEVLVEEEVDHRTSLMDESTPPALRSFVYYTPAGWQRWVSEAGKARKVNEGAYAYEAPGRIPALPIFRARIPLHRDVGYALATKANRLFNKESERDNLLRLGAMPRLVLGGSTTDFDKNVTDLTKGGNVIHESKEYTGVARYIAPEMAAAAALTEVVKAKTQDFYVTAFREYGDSARAAQRTATEVKQDVASGVAAMLQLLAAGLDDAENNAYWRVAQKEMPANRRAWYVARVQRTEDFAPEAEAVTIEQLRGRAFGTDPARGVPLGFDGLVEAVKQIAEYEGLAVDEEQVQAAVRADMGSRLMTAHPNLPWPPEVKVELMMNVVGMLGLAPNADEMMELADGTQVPRVAQMRKRALELAEAQDVAARREAETFGMAGGPAKPGMGQPAPAPEDDDAELRREAGAGVGA